MKILVLSSDYPNLEKGKANQFVHTRNIAYAKAEIEVEVLNFACQAPYVIDQIAVNPLSVYESDSLEKFDLVVSHASNLRNHYRFLSKRMNQIKQLVFFYHGHEVMKISKDYAKDYAFVKSNHLIKKTINDWYDILKLKVWHHFIKKYKHKISLVFVSRWMKNTFIKNVKFKESEIDDISNIIYNPVGNDFEKAVYSPTQIDYDFITIRSNLDGAKYCIDVVNQLAKDNADKTFLVVGKGEFFNHYQPPANLIWMNQTLNHDEIVQLLNKSRCGLFLTRTDAQGVMACEVATFGMPLLVSDIDVMHEVFAGFENVAFIDNDHPIIAKQLPTRFVNQKNKKYFEENTISKEIELFYRLNSEEKRK